MRAVDIMTRPVLTVRAEDSVECAAALFAEHNITAAPVVDAAGNLIGIVSEGDVLRTHRTHHPGASVAAVMSRTVVTVTLDADLSAVAAAMLDNNVHSVPIVDDDGSIEGMLCRHDLLRAYLRTDDLVQADVQQRLDQYSGGERIWNVTVIDGVADIAGRYDDEAERTVVGVLAHTVDGVSTVHQHG